MLHAAGGITILRSEAAVVGRSEASATAQGSVKIQDRSGRDWGTSVEAQLERRGVSTTDAAVILSDRPAKTTYEQIHSGKRAAMVASLADVSRFQAELNPEAWVVDVEKLSLIETVNLVALIHRARLGAS